jgi:uncharacterized protein YciI
MSSLFLYKIQLARPAILTDGPTPEEQAIMSQHADYLENLTLSGVSMLVGRTLTTDPSTFGIMIFKAESLDHAREIANRDPGVHSGIWHAELFPFRIAFLGDVQKLD